MPSFSATAEVPRIGVDAIDPAASGTTIELRERPRPLETMDEILREAPGARARRTSSYGGFTSLSLRGADAEHTTVLLGELPLIAADGSAVDLSTLPPWLFERIEVYRGGAPLWLSTGAIGGVLRLLPRIGRTQRAELSLGGGSFDRYQGRASAEVGDERLHAGVGASVVSSLGDFPYLDDGGTAFDPSDDRTRTRQNAQILEGSALGTLGARVLGGELGVVVTALERTGGLSPPPSRFVDVPTGRRSSQRYAGAASMDWVEGGRDVARAGSASWRLSTAIGFGFEERLASDPLAQFGQVPREATDDLLRLHGRVAGSLRVTDWLAITAVAQASSEQISSSDRLVLRVDPSRGRTGSHRESVAVGVEPRVAFVLGDVRVEGRVSGRIEGTFATLSDPSGDRVTEPLHVELALPTGRASVLVEVDRVLSFVGSASVGVRAPSSVELFGDRAYLAGNVLLSPETSVGGDLGVVLAGRTDVVRGRVEVRGFVTHVDDLIRYQRVAQNQAVPLNVQSARLFGGELGVTGDLLGHVRVDGALTLLETRDEGSGVPLPLRPWLVGYARATGHVDGDGAWSGGLAYVELEHVSSSTADPAGLVTIPARTPIGVGVSSSFLDDLLRLDISVRDVFDVRGYDVLGLPLPGRSVAVELTASGW